MRKLLVCLGMLIAMHAHAIDPEDGRRVAKTSASPAVKTTADRIGTAGDQVLLQVVQDLCKARLVFLGEEGTHGGGAAIEAKAGIVAGLIARCGFTHVVFESQVYDFEALKDQYKAKTASAAALHDAIGGLWSTTSEIDHLVTLLHAKALMGKVVLSGMDGQVGGSTGLYTQTKLGTALASHLPASERSNCSATINRLTGWGFDDETPYDDAFKQRIGGCMRDIEHAFAASGSGNARDGMLIHSFAAQLKFTDADYFNQRDRLMHQNLVAILQALPDSTRTVVWTANVHGLRRAHEGKHATASYPFDVGNAAIRSVAIVAAKGSYGRYGREPTTLLPATPDSLEGDALAGSTSGPVYIDAARLARYGTRKSRLLGYGAYTQADWSKLFDGVLVLDEEHPPHFVRPPQPMQAAE